MQFECFPEYFPRMFSVQDDFPGTFPDIIFRDGISYNFRDVPHTLFPVTFSGCVFGDVSGHVIFGSVSRDGLQSRVSYTVSDTFFRYVFAEAFCQSRFIGCVLRRFRSRFHVPFPEPFPQRHFRVHFPETFPQRRFLPPWRELLDV